ncbi:MAG: hypothetical protein ACTSPN_09295 [Promethearchaeota archaeon]
MIDLIEYMPKCPFCEVEIHIQDFFEVYEKESKKGKVKTRVGNFKGETINPTMRNYMKMWFCPSCDKILGFSEYRWDRA